MLTYLSVCSGIEAASVAWEPLGWEAVGFSEIEPFPRAVLSFRFPHVPLHGDFTELIKDPPSCDVLVGGTPCFPAGALILSRRGLVPIEEIRVGDEVLTHKQRWRKVVALMSREAATIVVKGQGHDGLVTTEEHPFWSKATARRWDNSRRNWTKTRSRAGWVDAKDMRGKHWATPCSVPAAAPPACEGVVFSDEFFWVVGAWLGDGWTSLVPRTGRKTGKQNRVLVCARKGSQSEELAQRISAAGLRAGRSSQRTTDRFQMTSKSLSFWLREHFEQGAEHKTIPAWVLGMPESWRRALLDGYLFADGHDGRETQKVTTVSRKLVVGVRLLAASLGRASSVVLNKPRRKKPLTIEGRAVQELGFFWQVSLPSRSRSAFVEDDCVWGLVRSVRPTGRVERVYNFEVAEDNSYVVDGMIVHNCQAFSVAGARRSLEDVRGNLTLAYIELANAIDWRNHAEGKEPCIAVWENVPGVFSTKDNAFGCFLGGLAGGLSGEDGPLEPPGGRWTHCGVVFGPQRTVAWRVLDAQYFGLAQRRQRVFVVASAREGFDPSQVLLEWDGVRRDSAPRRETRETSAPASGISSAKRRRGRMTDVYLGNAEGGAREAPFLTTSNLGKTVNNQTPLVGVAAASAQGSFPWPQEVADPLTANEAKTYTQEGSNNFRTRNVVPHAQAQEPFVFDTTQVTHPENRCKPQPGDPSHPLAAAGHPPTLVAPLAFQTSGFGASISDIASTMQASYDRLSNQIYGCLQPPTLVRRLTPRECEHLQGFPDDWTLIPWKGKPALDCPDGPRYKALGNSMAVPVMQWIGRRIEAYLSDL